MSERALNSWVWKGDELCDADGETIAYVVADVITVGRVRLLIEHTVGGMRFRMRGTSPEGPFGTITQPLLTLTTLTAQCGERKYRMVRINPFSSKRRIFFSDGRLAATVTPHFDGTIVVEDGVTELPLLDAVFLTWGCVLVDRPRKNMQI